MQAKTLFGAMGITFLILLAGVARADIVQSNLGAEQFDRSLIQMLNNQL